MNPDGPFIKIHVRREKTRRKHYFVETYFNSGRIVYMNEDGEGGAIIRPTLSETMHTQDTDNDIFTRESAKEIIKLMGKYCNLIKLHLPGEPGDIPVIYFNPGTIVYFNDSAGLDGAAALIRTTLSEGNDWHDDADDIFVRETSKKIMAAIARHSKTAANRGRNLREK